MTPSIRVTLSHELVHVLQDQHFDLEKLTKLPEGQAETARAMAEGDAERIEDRYVATVLTSEERQAYEAESAKSGDAAKGTIDQKVPEALTASFAAPYIFGPALIAYLNARGHNTAIDDAFRDVPGDKALYDPIDRKNWTATKPLELDVPKGAKKVDSGSFGASTWYLMLASRIDPHEALRAVDGIQTDGYVTYKQSGKVCTELKGRVPDSTDALMLTQAVAKWVDQSRGSSHSAYKPDEEVVDLVSCDPGANAKTTGSGASVDLFVMPVARTQTYVQLVDAGASAPVAHCLAEKLVEKFTIDQLKSDTYLDSPEAQGALAGLRQACTG